MQKKRNREIANIILKTVAVSGIVAVGLVAPGVLGAMAQLGVVPGRRQKEVINNARTRLIQQGMLSHQGGKVFLTPKGKKVLRRWQLKNYHIAKPKSWDKKWRVLIFDIPERRRTMRTRIRHVLADIGFMRLQDSVWIHPYECEDFVALLKADFHIGKDLLYLTVESLEFDRPWRHAFQLS